MSDRGGGSPALHADVDDRRQRLERRSDEGESDSAASPTHSLRRPRALETAAHSTATAEDADSTTGIANSVGYDMAGGTTP